MPYNQAEGRPYIPAVQIFDVFLRMELSCRKTHVFRLAPGGGGRAAGYSTQRNAGLKENNDWPQIS
jgi:hypothetical protein